MGEVVVRDAHIGTEILSLKGHSAWDAETGYELLTLRGGPVRGMALTSNSNQLFVHAGRTVKIYDATPLPEKP